MCERRREDLKLDRVQQEQTLAFGGLVGAEDGEVETRPDDDRDEDLVGDLDEDVGEEEGFPGVGFGGPFAHFVQGALEDEAGHDLLNDLVSTLRCCRRKSRMKEQKGEGEELTCCTKVENVVVIIKMANNAFCNPVLLAFGLKNENPTNSADMVHNATLPTI